jgi:hypothetical protein
MQPGRRKINGSESGLLEGRAEYIYKVPSFCIESSTRVSQIFRLYYFGHVISVATEAKE